VPRLAVLLLFAFIVFGTSAAPAVAQPASAAKLIVTVVDPSKLVVPGATVTVVGLEAATAKATIPPVKSSDKGVATFERVPPGRYSVSGEFPGFEIGLIKEVRLKAGDNRHLLVLPMAKMTEEITVGRDKQAAASDRGSTFGTALTREQVAALSDDPDEMARQLQDMAGPGAAIRVDSFEGSQLPPKAQIKSIHITRDMFAAENHSAGGLFIDIITQPGLGALRGNARYSFYDSAFDGSNPLVPKKGPARTQNFSVGIGGSLAKEKSSFNVSVGGTSSYRTPNLYAAVPAGVIAQNVNVRMPTDTLYFSGLFDYALTKDQTLRVSANRQSSRSENQGVGAYDLPGRGYSNDNSNFGLRVQEAGPIGRRFFINTRFLLNWADSTSTSNVEAMTITVLDAFTGGGAQRAGGRHTRTFSLQSDLDYVRGRHSWRGGISLNGGSYGTDEASNYLGSYTFTSLDAYDAGLPTTFTRRIGDPNISYWNLQAGFYVQDDIRLSKTLTISPGLRIEAQTHLADYNNFGPRIGVTWAPFKSGKTTLRASAGRFYDWLSAGTYEQTLRIDGYHQQELNISDPSYPDPGSEGVIPPTNRYQLDSGMQMAANTRLSVGVDQQITKVFRVNALYYDTHTSSVLVGVDLNSPVNGGRPYPQFANLIDSVSEGSQHSRAMSINASLNFAQMFMGPATTGPRFSWKRGLMLYTGYTLAKSENDTDGPFSVPASGTYATEWGPSSSDVRHRVSLSMFSTALKNLTAMIGVYVSSGTPYTIRTGYDDNGDGLFNDRPAGVGRNTVRGAGSWNSYGNFTYTIGMGRKKVPGGTGFAIQGGPGGVSVTSLNMGDQSRYRLSFTLNVENLANHANYVNYSGTMTSPFFLKPTAVEGVRTMNLSMGFSF